MKPVDIGSARPLSRVDELRVLAGFAVQPFVAALVAFITFQLTEFTGRLLYGQRSFDPLDSATAFAIGVGIVAIGVTVFGALPVLTWKLKHGPLTRRQVFVSGALLGNLPSALIVCGLVIDQLRRDASPDLGALTYGLPGLIRVITFGSFIGITSAAVFWWLAGRHIVEGSKWRASSEPNG